MSTKRWIPAIATAWLAAGAACSDSVAPTAQAAAEQSGPALVSIIGIVHQTAEIRGSFLLSTDDGQEITLSGANLTSVASLESAEVEVRGTWDAADGSLEVSDFVVRSVAGVAAMDGILVARYDESGQDLNAPTLLGYGLQLTRGGTIDLTDPPADLIAHVGERVWVTGDSNAPPAAYGFIQ